MIPSHLQATPPSFKSHGLSSSFFGLSSAVGEHLLALFSLASFETGELFKKTLVSLFLFVALVVALFIAYLVFLATVTVVAIVQFHVSWPLALGILTVTHLLIATVLMLLLRQRYQASPAFQMTTAEIQRDLEALSSK